MSTVTVPGSWHPASSSADTDLDAQTIAGSFVLPTTPEPVRAAPLTRTPYGITTETIDDFFGATSSHATRESQHDSRSTLNDDIPNPPPPYADAELPAYSADPNTEPITLAMYLFKFGFLFPPFWVLGALILISPLTAPVEFEPSKSETERAQLVRIIRDVEVKWAKRCAWALVALFVLGGVVAAIVAVTLAMMHQ